MNPHPGQLNPTGQLSQTLRPPTHRSALRTLRQAEGGNVAEGRLRCGDSGFRPPFVAGASVLLPVVFFTPVKVI